MKAKFWCAVIAIGLMSISIPQAALAQESNSVETELSVSQQKEVERATKLNQQAIELYKLGQYSEATTLFKEALQIRQELYADDHTDIATSLNNLAFIYNAQGKFSEAESVYQDVLAMNKRLFGDNHSDVARSLNNLAGLYHDQRRYSEAKPLYQQALAIRQRLFRGDHPDVARSLNNLAGLYHDLGGYSEAEPLYQQALAMRQQLFRGNHPDVASSFNNLAALYKSQGRYLEAEPLYQQALAMRQQLFRGDRPDVADSFNNLAALYLDLGRYSEAESLYHQALAMRQRLFRDDHPDVASSFNNLAGVYKSQGRYSKAELLFQQALAMRQRLFRGDRLNVADSLGNLAGIYYDQKKYVEAEPLFQQALAMKNRLLPDNHPNLANSLSNIGLFYQAQSQYPQALNYLTQAAETEEAIIAENLLIGSEQQKKQFLNLFQGNTDTTISFHLQAVPENLDAAQLALNTILRRKGRILDATGQALQTLRDNLDPESEKLFTQLASTQTELANLSSRPLPDDAPQKESVKAQKTELDREIKELEAQLSSRSAEFAQETTPVTIAAVQQVIPQNAALIEFIQYRPFDPKESKYSEPRYAVYVLLPNGDLQWQDLGEASGIDPKIKCFRDSLSKKGERGLGAVSSCPENFSTVARELDELLMKPVRGMIGGATHLLLSPDSQLNTLPFAALVDEQDKYLVGNYLITYLTSGRDLLRLQLNQDKQLSEPLLMANPTYSAQGIAVANADNKADKDLNRGRRSGELATLEPFTQLEGTKIEGEAIAQIVPNSKLLTEQKASENNLKETKNPEFLHLATHGFFLPPQPKEPKNDRNNQTPVFSTVENPLLRSGLALAGFNQRDSGEEDGVLTALEVTGLNLRGTKLVVMSACETGLGDVQAGEGVYGLRRAFTLAGAQSQLMSLWNVSDDGTKDLMVNYYTKIQNGEARGEALRQVQLEMLQSAERSHPFYWAAFIPSGSWLPLDSSN